MRTISLMTLPNEKPGIAAGADTTVILALSFVRVAAWYLLLT